MEGGGFSALRECRAPSPRVQSRTREAQPTQSGGLFGIDVKGGLFGMSGGSYGWGDQSCSNHQGSRDSYVASECSKRAITRAEVKV